MPNVGLFVSLHFVLDFPNKYLMDSYDIYTLFQIAI